MLSFLGDIHHQAEVEDYALFFCKKLLPLDKLKEHISTFMDLMGGEHVHPIGSNDLEGPIVIKRISPRSADISHF